MNKAFRVSNGSLSIDGKEIELPYLIKESKIINDVLIVLLEPPSDTSFNRNIFAVDLNGVILWQIAESPHGGDRAKPYLSLALNGSGGIFAENWIGVSYQINLIDGSVVAKSFDRF